MVKAVRARTFVGWQPMAAQRVLGKRAVRLPQKKVRDPSARMNARLVIEHAIAVTE